jgi:LysR family cyn operon transcriptional activator
MIELRHLRYFLAIAKFQHLTKAAESLFVTQSTLSHQLKQLESFLEVQLFDRVGRGVELSAAGKSFFAYATRALREVEEGALALRNIDSLAQGRLRIGGISTYINSLLPPVLASLVERYPNISISAEALSAGEVSTALQEGEIDLGVSFLDSFKGDFIVEPLFSEALVLTVSTAHPLAGQETIDAADLSGLSLVVQTSRYHSRHLIDELIGPRIADNIQMELSSIECMLEVVKLNSSIAAVHFEHKLRVDPQLVHLPILNPGVARTAALIWHRQRSETALLREVSRMIQAAANAP